MIPDETVERVREAADIVQIIGEHVNLKRTGSDYRGPCPFHQGTHRNFSVKPQKGIYYCFVCHEGGDVFTFLQKRLGMDWPTAVKYVAERAGIVVEEVHRRREGPDPRQPFWEVNAAAAAYFRDLLWDDDEGRPARDYLALRRVSREAAERFALGFAPRDDGAMRAYLNALGIDDERLVAAGLLVPRDETGELRPRFRNRLIFPILDAAGNHVGFGGRLLGPGEPKYLNSAESPVFSKARLLYGLHLAKHGIRREDRVMIVEGYFDVVRLVSVGLDWVVAPLGTALTDGQAALLRRYTKNAFLLYDSDRAGLRATFRSGDELLRHGMSVQVVTLPDGEDPDSFVDKHGPERLAAQLHASIDVFERKVQLLERAGWFGDLRRKRRALDRLLPTIRATSDVLTRDMYLTRASEAAGVNKELLVRELGDVAAHEPHSAGGAPQPVVTPSLAESRGGDRRRQGRRRRAVLWPIERQLIRVVLHDRPSLEAVTEQLGPEDFDDPAFRDIYRAILAAPAGASAADVASKLQPDSIEVLAELQETPLGEGLNYQAIVEGGIAKLRGLGIRRRLGEIEREMAIASEEEKNRLISEKNRLNRELTALGGGTFKSFDRTR